MTAKSPSPETTPVILAIGETSLKTDDLADALEPVDLMAQALAAAEEDAGASVLAALDRVCVIGVVSWLYKDPAKLLCERMQIDPARKTKAGMGGEKPVRLLHEAALAIQSGEAQSIAVVGGEAQNAFRKARRTKTRLDWTPRATKEEAWDDIEDTTLGVRPQALKLGVQSPAQIYPFFENALTGALGLTPTEAVRRAAEIWAAYAAQSADNPFAWSRKAYAAKDIATMSAHNRMVAFPYPKLMVANDSVNQAAAVIVASLAFARARGVAEDRLVFFQGGASAQEPDDFLLRQRYDRCPAMDAVLEAASRIAGGAAAFDLAEIYSCFPVVPKLALETLRDAGLSDRIAPSVTGGLTFFGGPLNNYMGHAACAMTRRLRAGDGALGLLYGQGGVMTKHHALILSSAPRNAPLDERPGVQSDADERRGDPPVVLEAYEGAAEIETYTAYYDADGEPAFGAVIAREPNGRRLLARVSGENEASISLLTDFDRSAIGRAGNVRCVDGRMTWRAD